MVGYLIDEQTEFAEATEEGSTTDLNEGQSKVALRSSRHWHCRERVSRQLKNVTRPPSSSMTALKYSDGAQRL